MRQDYAATLRLERNAGTRIRTESGLPGRSEVRPTAPFFDIVKRHQLAQHRCGQPNVISMAAQFAHPPELVRR